MLFSAAVEVSSAIFIFSSSVAETSTGGDGAGGRDPRPGVPPPALSAAIVRLMSLLRWDAATARMAEEPAAWSLVLGELMLLEAL